MVTLCGQNHQRKEDDYKRENNRSIEKIKYYFCLFLAVIDISSAMFVTEIHKSLYEAKTNMVSSAGCQVSQLITNFLTS